ncbi:MAG: type II secretion system F family protein [Rhodospirillales bacterium]|nr:type II secretion system F family protein [Rhodospirillales bacterium]
MEIHPITMVYVAIFVAVLFLIEGIYFLTVDLRGSPTATVNRRLRLLASGSQEAMLKLRRKSPDEQTSGPARWLARLSPYRKLDDAIAAAGIAIPTYRLALMMVALTVIGIAVATKMFAVPWAVAVGLGLVAGLLVPVIGIAGLRRRRLVRFQQQLPEAIDMIVRSLRAGHPISTAIGAVAREMPDPVGSEFGLVFDEMTYGLDLREALVNLGARVPVSDLRYMIVAVRVQYGTGGNLAEVLSSLSRVMRERARMHHKITALSAEGRFSALILTILPFFTAGLIAYLNPDYYRSVMSDPAFPFLIGGGLTGLVIGIFVMHRLVNFRV